MVEEKDSVKLSWLEVKLLKNFNQLFLTSENLPTDSSYSYATFLFGEKYLFRLLKTYDDLSNFSRVNYNQEEGFKWPVLVQNTCFRENPSPVPKVVKDYLTADVFKEEIGTIRYWQTISPRIRNLRRKVMKI